MTIDIIDLKDPEYADLSALQLAMVRVAQTKKDRILAEAEEKKRDLFYTMLSANVVRSSARKAKEAAMDAQAEREIDAVREDLLHQLAYEALGWEGNEQGAYRYPQNPNYNLSASQRFLVVRNYYMGVTSDPAARLQAYSMDSLARSYLGEYYDTLYDMLASYI